MNGQDSLGAGVQGQGRFARLPTEILVMIASHSSPGSLLAMSRTSRFFRSLLFTKRAEPVWRVAREQEGWPQLKADTLNEIKYARLLSEEVCSVCGDCDHNPARPNFDLRLTICFVCAITKIKPRPEILHLHPDLHLQTFAFAIPTYTFHYGCFRSITGLPFASYYFIPDVLEQSAHLWDLANTAQGQSLSASKVYRKYGRERIEFLKKNGDDAAKLSANADRLAKVETEEELRTRRLRAELIDDKLLALGFHPFDLQSIHTDMWWCEACYHQDYASDLERFKESGYFVGSELVPAGADGGHSSYDSERREEEIMEQMLDEWHSDCIPAPGHLQYAYTYPLEVFTDEEWTLRKEPYITYCEEQREHRRWEATVEARDARMDALRPLFERLKDVVASSGRNIFVSFRDFLGLPSIKSIWRVTDRPVDPTAWSSAESAILREMSDSSRLAKLRIFDRVARCLLADGHPLPPHVVTALGDEPSVFVDHEPSKGIAPLHAALTDADLDPILSRVTSLLRCGCCSTKLTYPAIATHLFDVHGACLVSSSCLPSESFRAALKHLLSDLGAPMDISTADFEAKYGRRRFDTYLRTKRGGTRLSHFETWAQVTAGSTTGEQRVLNDGFRRDSRDRDIVEIKPSGFPVLRGGRQRLQLLLSV